MKNWLIFAPGLALLDTVNFFIWSYFQKGKIEIMLTMYI